MKIRLLVLSMCLLVASCEEKTREEIQLVLRNGTDYQVAVKMYPQFEYAKSGSMYEMSDRGSGHLSTDFNLAPGQGNRLYYSGNINQRPEALFAKVFAGISAWVATTADEHHIQIDQNGQKGYLKDPSKDGAGWAYEVVESDRSTQFKKKPVTVHQYTFTITEDNFDRQ